MPAVPPPAAPTAMITTSLGESASTETPFTCLPEVSLKLGTRASASMVALPPIHALVRLMMSTLVMAAPTPAVPPIATCPATVPACAMLRA